MSILSDYFIFLFLQVRTLEKNELESGTKDMCSYFNLNLCHNARRPEIYKMTSEIGLNKRNLIFSSHISHFFYLPQDKESGECRKYGVIYCRKIRKFAAILINFFLSFLRLLLWIVFSLLTLFLLDFWSHFRHKILERKQKHWPVDWTT